MKRVTRGVLLLLLLVSIAELLVARRERQEEISQAQRVMTKEEEERLLAIGKKLFVERCAKCHNERGDKPLKSGAPLSERKLSSKDIARVVSGRFRDAPGEQKRAVALYISSFMKRN